MPSVVDRSRESPAGSERESSGAALTRGFGSDAACRGRFHVETLGCKVNLSDSMALDSRLRGDGWERAASAAEADLVVVNSCAVTGHADQGARRLLRRLRRENPRARLVVTGCLATLDPGSVSAWVPDAEVVPRGTRLRVLPALSGRAPAAPDACDASPLDPSEGTLWDAPTRYPSFPAAGHTRAFLKVQDGCDASCSFCVIPTTRGRSRSLPLEEVVARVRGLAEEGAREVVLTGIHLGHWGRELGSDLPRLLDALQALERPARIRLTSVEPNEMSDEVVARLAASGKLAPHVHLPLQSGADPVLARMRRPYTRARYARTVERVARALDRPGIGADVIAGFPGETEADHRATLDLVGGLPLTYLHVFTWSPRPGTDASSFAGRVPAEVAAHRSRELRELGAALERRAIEGLLGREELALTLLGGEESTEAITGRFVHVRLAGRYPSNELVQVRMAGLSASGAIAEPLPSGAGLTGTFI